MYAKKKHCLKWFWIDTLWSFAQLRCYTSDTCMFSYISFCYLIGFSIKLYRKNSTVSRIFGCLNLFIPCQSFGFFFRLFLRSNWCIIYVYMDRKGRHKELSDFITIYLCFFSWIIPEATRNLAVIRNALQFEC